MGIHRSSLRYQARPDRSVDLARRISELAQRHPRSGYRTPVEFKRDWLASQSPATGP